MQRFLSTNSNSTTQGDKRDTKQCDLLELMKRTAAVPSSSASHCNTWAKRDTIVGSTTLKCNDMTKRMNTDPKGWKNVDGTKTYTTFRNGKLVSSSGFAGHQMYQADQKGKSSSKKNESENLKKRKVVDNAQDNKNSGKENNKSSIEQAFKRVVHTVIE